MRNTEGLSDAPEILPLTVPTTSFLDISIRQLSTREGDSVKKIGMIGMCCPTFTDLVRHVVCVCTKEEMTWVAARWIVASMENAKFSRMPVRKQPCDAGCPPAGHLGYQPVLPIPLDESPALPFPALFRAANVNLLPESSPHRLRHEESIPRTHQDEARQRSKVRRSGLISQRSIPDVKAHLALHSIQLACLRSKTTGPTLALCQLSYPPVPWRGGTRTPGLSLNR